MKRKERKALENHFRQSRGKIIESVHLAVEKAERADRLIQPVQPVQPVQPPQPAVTPEPEQVLSSVDLWLLYSLGSWNTNPLTGKKENA